jgi:hypothetical protein
MAEVAYSEPAPTLIPSPAEMEEPALPTAETAPGDDGPTVLPKRDELPARPRAGRRRALRLNVSRHGLRRANSLRSGDQGRVSEEN